MSETFSTLHGLVNKGVNVVMDIPFELWNETSAEVADLKKQVITHNPTSDLKPFRFKNPGSFVKRKTGQNKHIRAFLTCMCVSQCDVLVEKYEDVIEDWYKGSQEEDLTTYLCEKHVLKGQDTGNPTMIPSIFLPVIFPASV